jgi:redox-sensitive bicupin YhaK (pirin superfamily)
MERKIMKLVNGYETQDGAGVKLVRVLGNEDTIGDGEVQWLMAASRIQRLKRYCLKMGN